MRELQLFPLEASEFNRQIRGYDWTKIESCQNKHINEIQERFKCCGYYNKQDWDSRRPLNISENYYPKSCCINYDYIFQNSIEYPLCIEKFIGLGCKEKIGYLERIIKLIMYLNIASSYLILLFLVIFLTRSRISNDMQELR